MVNRAAFTDAVTKEVRTFENPPWRLVNLTPSLKGAMVKLRSDDGGVETFNVDDSPEAIKSRLRNWD